MPPHFVRRKALKAKAELADQREEQCWRSPRFLDPIQEVLLDPPLLLLPFQLHVQCLRIKWRLINCTLETFLDDIEFNRFRVIFVRIPCLESDVTLPVTSLTPEVVIHLTPKEIFQPFWPLVLATDEKVDGFLSE